MVRAADGSTIILDDRGIVQTWQEGQAENVDATHPLILNLYLPATVRQIHLARLRFRLLPFRAFASTTQEGGQTIVTSASGGGGTTSSAEGGGSYPTTQDGEWYYWGSGHIPSDIFTDGDGYHNHGLYNGYEIYQRDPSTGSTFWVGYTASGYHAHSSPSGHTHDVVIPSHSHLVDLPNHTHDVNLPSHSHGIAFGIYEGTTPQNVTVKINGVDRTSALGGPFNSDQADLNIAPYLTVGQWNTIELGSSRLGRIDATVFVQVLITV